MSESKKSEWVETSRAGINKDKIVCYGLFFRDKHKINHVEAKTWFGSVKINKEFERVKEEVFRIILEDGSYVDYDGEDMNDFKKALGLL